MLLPMLSKFCTLLSDREGHGHKAVVYKSHFPPLRHSVVTETPADTLANKPRLHQRPSSLFFMPPRHGGSSDKILRSQDY